MDDQFFRDIFRALRNEATNRRDSAPKGSVERDRWSAVDGLLTQADHRMRS